MIPKKLFNNKCLHPDRDQVFKDDLDMLYNCYLATVLGLGTDDQIMKVGETDDMLLQASNQKAQFFKLNLSYTTSFENPDKFVSYNSDLLSELDYLYSMDRLNFEIFKSVWKQKKFTLIHHSKYKEENTIEYYQVLFEQVQLYLFPDNPSNMICKIFAIYCIYSLYHTQPYRIKFQVTTIPECLESINDCIRQVKLKQKSLFITIYSMIDSLQKQQAFKIGVILGLKTIILNKYGLPIELKSDIYSEFKQLFKSNSHINNMKESQSKEIESFKPILKDYKLAKMSLVNEIKSLFNLENSNDDKALYCSEMNSLKQFCGKSQQNKANSYNNYTNIANFGVRGYHPSDLQLGEISRLDVNFDNFDDSVYQP